MLVCVLVIVDQVVLVIVGRIVVLGAQAVQDVQVHAQVHVQAVLVV